MKKVIIFLIKLYKKYITKNYNLSNVKYNVKNFWQTDKVKKY